MPSPFPGMDPYLEAPGIWPDFHNRLAEHVSSVLNEMLPSRYYAQLEARTEVGIGGQAPRVVVPDVSVRRSAAAPESAAVALAEPRQEVSEAFEVVLDAEPVELTSIEIRDAYDGHDIVTLIELLSPSDKRPGVDRDRFLEKRRRILDGDTSLVEIDLLRSGTRAWNDPSVADRIFATEPKPDYFISVSRAWRRTPSFRLQVFPVSLRAALPVISLPLREAEPELPFDFQFAFGRAYDAGPYRRGAVDYSRPPATPLTEENQAWAAERVAAWFAAR